MNNIDINHLPSVDEEENALIEYANDLAERHKDRIASEVIRLTSDMDRIAEETPRAVIPEFVFVNYFLNFFFDIATGNDRTNEGLLLKWLELAGGWRHEVNVVDNQGKIMYTIPALYESGFIEHSQLTNVNFTTMGKMFNSYSTRTPEEGVNILANELSRLPKFIRLDGDKSAGLAWRRIFIKYGLLVDPNSAKKPSPKFTPQDKIEIAAKTKGTPILEDLGIIDD